MKRQEPSFSPPAIQDLRRQDILRFSLWGLFFFHSIWGILAIFAAREMSADPWILPLRQCLWMLAGAVVMFFCGQIPFRLWRRTAPVFGLLVPIVLTTVMLWGTRINGMQGWFTVGNIQLQPSELLKGPFLLFLAVILSLARSSGSRLLYLFALLITASGCFLLLLEPDCAMALMYLAMFFLLLFLCGVSRKYFLLTLAGIPILFLAALWKFDYLKDRLHGFLDPASDPTGAGWHVRQFLSAAARGGETGRGLFDADWSNIYLPFAYNDSIFATIMETIGCLGALIYLAAAAGLFAVIFLLAEKSREPSRQLFLYGAAFFYGLQTLLHVSINLVLLPPSGLTLPLISYGGSSMLCFAIIFGLVLSASDTQELLSQE